jgi:hypothetical protein
MPAPSLKVADAPFCSWDNFAATHPYSGGYGGRLLEQEKEPRARQWGASRSSASFGPPWFGGPAQSPLQERNGVRGNAPPMTPAKEQCR